MKKRVKACSTNVKDYPESMSSYERESLAAEAALAEQRKAKKKLDKKLQKPKQVDASVVKDSRRRGSPRGRSAANQGA